MKHAYLTAALQNIDPQLIEEALSLPAIPAGRSPERKRTMGHYENKRHGISMRKLTGLVLAACLVFALTICAYAANLFGIREMFRSANRELPEAAEPYIQDQGENASMTGLSAEVTQSLCDGSRLLVTLELHGKEDYFLLEQSIDPQDSVRNIGVDGDESVEAYTHSLGKKLLQVGILLKGENQIGIQSTQFRYHGDGNMTALVEAGLNGDISEAVCLISAVEPGGNVEDVERLEIPVQISGAPKAAEKTYVPEKPDAIPGMTVGNATVTETPMGITIRWLVTMMDEEALNGMKVELDGLDYGEGGMVWEEDGNWYFTASLIQGDIGDHFLATFYDGNGVVLGQIQFQKT